MGGLAPIPSSSILSFTTPSIVTEAGLVAASILSGPTEPEAEDRGRHRGREARPSTLVRIAIMQVQVFWSDESVEKPLL